MTNSPQQNDTPDYEARFYTVLAEGLGGEPMPTFDDFLNVHDGQQATRDVDGNLAVLLVLTPQGEALLHEACQHSIHHDCADAVKFADFLLLTIGALAKNA